MTRLNTAAETKQQHIDAMGEELGSLYNNLWNELVWINAKWNEYTELFGTKPSRIELLNRVAGKFFKIVQDSLFEGTLLAIARITDSTKTGKKNNCTIRQFPLHISDADLRLQVEQLLATVTCKTSFCRDWRNKRIAHNDYELAMSEGTKTLEPASRLKVMEAIQSIDAVFDAISLHYYDSTTAFEGVGNADGALSLLYVIDDGLRFQDEK